MDHDFKTDEARFTHLPRTARKAISDQLHATHQLVATGEKAGESLKHLTRDMLHPAKMPELARELWTAAIMRRRDEKGHLSQKAQLAYLAETLATKDETYLRLHQKRSKQEADQESAAMDVHKDIIANSWLKYRTTHTYLEDLGVLVNHSARWLKTLTPEERQGVFDFVSPGEKHAQAKYLPLEAVTKAYDDLYWNALIQEIWKGLLVETPQGIEVSRDQRQVIRDTMHFVSPHDKDR